MKEYQKKAAKTKNSPSPKNVHTMVNHYFLTFGTWPWEEMDKDILVNMFAQGTYPKEWGKTFWADAQGPLLEEPIPDKTLRVNRNAGFYAVGKKESVQNMLFERVRLQLYANPIPDGVKKLITKSFKTNCWSNVEENVVIHRGYMKQSLSSMAFAMVLVCDRVAGRDLEKPIALGFMTLQVYPKASQFTRGVKVIDSSHKVDRQGLIESLDAPFPDTDDLFLSEKAKERITASVQFPPENGAVLYVDLVCSRYKFGSTMLDLLEKPKWKEFFGHSAIALRAIDDVYAYYPQKGYLRTRDNKAFYPIYVGEDGRPVYTLDKSLAAHARFLHPPREVFEHDDLQGYLYFKSVSSSKT